jgi:hypothetical protein
VRKLNRLERVGETLRATLNVDGCLDPRISGAGCLNWWGETGR